MNSGQSIGSTVVSKLNPPNDLQTIVGKNSELAVCQCISCNITPSGLQNSVYYAIYLDGCMQLTARKC